MYFKHYANYILNDQSVITLCIYVIITVELDNNNSRDFKLCHLIYSLQTCYCKNIFTFLTISCIFIKQMYKIL